MSRIVVHDGGVAVSPEEAGYNPDNILRLNEHFIKLIDAGKLQCASYLMARNGKVFALKSMGKLRYNNEDKDFMPDSVRTIASITKAFTAVCTLQLVEKGLIYLKQPLYTIFDEFNVDPYREITVFHLITHTSGLRGNSPFFPEAYPFKWWDMIEDGNWIKAAIVGTPHSEPGKEWIYSNFSFMLLGEIVTRISGIRYEEYVRRNVLEPLGMNRSFFEMTDTLKEEVCVINEWDEKHLYLKSEKTPGDPPKSAGGLYSTLEDLFKFGQMLLNKGIFNGEKILGRKTVETMTRNHLTNMCNCGWGDCIEDFPYALGLGMNTRKDMITSPGTFSHEGAGRSALYMDPSENFLAAYFVPSTCVWAPESVISTRSIMWSGIK